MKVLCFTPSYYRYKMLRGCIRDIQNQSYNVTHCVNITLNQSDLEQGNSIVDTFFGDLKNENLYIDYSLNQHPHWNYMNTIKLVPNYKEYDLFVKIDDDDIYKKDYVKNIVDFFTSFPKTDITSTRIKYYLKGTKFIINNKGYDNLGANPEGTDYHMPFTFAFNRKAFQSVLELKNEIPNRIIHGSDRIWRYKWEKDGLKHNGLNNMENIIWYVHGANISTSGFLNK